jgi:predicted ArsR family transcriptional regulator
MTDQPAPSSRERIIELLRRRDHSVDELAAELSVTGNAIRQHLAQLQSEGLVEPSGIRRPPGAGKPATLYRVPDQAADRFSRAYAPVLAALVDELADGLSKDELVALMERTGRRLGASTLSVDADKESLRGRAAELLGELGASATVDLDGDIIRIEGALCPLASAVRSRTEVCEALRAFLSAALRTEVIQCCSYEGRPRCGFAV